MGNPREAAARLAAIEYVQEASEANGGMMSWSELTSFSFDGKPVSLIGARGIWWPAGWSMPISITTSPSDPYGDDVLPNGHLAYRYYWRRVGDEGHRDNVGLREAMRQGVPLIYLKGFAKGWYQVIAPALIVADDPLARTYAVAFDEVLVGNEALPPNLDPAVRRAYATQLALRRLHQSAFRQRVLVAYQRACAICQLRVAGLLDAAHIVGDRHVLGSPVVPNGLALCKIHHAAFDQDLIGIRPDNLIVEVKEDLLKQTDGPMLRHGLQEAHGARLTVPRRADHRPDRARLEIRYEEFRRAS